MKRSFFKMLGQVTVLCGLLVLVTGAQAQDTRQEGLYYGNSLEGTWQAQTTIRNCQTGAVMENFSKFVSFNKGGTAQEVSSSTLFRSTALGIWEDRGGSARYLLRFFRFNPDGTTAGSIRALWYVTHLGDSYRATAFVEVIAPNGVVVALICGSETANRVEFPF